MFRYLAVCGVLLLVAQLSLCHPTEEMKKLFDTCQAESNVNIETLKAFLKGGMKTEEATPEIKCFTKCLMEKQGQFKNGVLNEEATRKALLEHPELKNKEAEVNKFMSECKGLKGSNECDTAFQIGQCMFKKGMDL
ncbi:general odorant-binding protein 56h-like [Teleopsis dalmanni]|uniref:general odorant-binding protein 56h-like n=1 Tax=Teleopsis dalmanni TaxID=139649 RepID=UPI000D32B0ED|nr:general odorant-binding protein 56h-like [Teleopsis dalmanni]